MKEYFFVFIFLIFNIYINFFLYSRITWFISINGAYIMIFLKKISKLKSKPLIKNEEIQIIPL